MHLLLIFVALFVVGFLVVSAIRWVTLLLEAYRKVSRHFSIKAISYPAIMQSYTKGSLEVIGIDAARSRQIEKSHHTRNSKKQTQQRRDALALPSALGEASITGALMLKDYLSVDSHFYNAMSSMAGHQIANFADLHEQVSHYATNGFGEMSSHVVDNVQGHLAEQIVAEHLRHLGHHVEMAATSNQSGWDIIVDHAFRINVKNYADPNSFSEHFQHHPDVAVIVPHGVTGNAADFDAASGLDHLHHAFQVHQAVISDGGLDHDAVVSHAHHALNAAHGHVPMHFPWITVCMSSVKEANLLLEGSTELSRSATNVALDAAGTGIGGLGGKIAGAAIGTMIAPGIGTLIGGLLGAIAGGLGGRAVSDNIKEAPLREARENYLTTRDFTQNLMNKTRKAAELKYANYVNQANEFLGSEAEAQKQSIKRIEIACNQNLLKAASFDEKELAAFTAKVRTELHKERQQAEQQVRQSWHALKMLWPNANFATNYVALHFSQKRNNQFAEKFIQIEGSAATNHVRTAAYLQVSLSLGYGLEEAKHHFEKISRQSSLGRNYLSKIIEQAKGKVLAVREGQVRLLQCRTQEIAQEMELAVKDAVLQLKDHETALHKELKAFGKA